MSVGPVICVNQQCQYVQCDSEHTQPDHNAGQISVVAAIKLCHTARQKGITHKNTVEGRQSMGAVTADVIQCTQFS
jgi:hypothetical protein